jgi:hypothetical protein
MELAMAVVVLAVAVETLRRLVNRQESVRVPVVARARTQRMRRR